jgi:succinylglutamate desuccinylase
MNADPALFYKNMSEMIHKQIGSGYPSIAIVGCLHGDEIIGKKVITALSNIKLNKGSITFFIAHTEALKRKKRFITEDLNRVFPGKANGNLEEKIAFALTAELKKFDVVIDIHATNSDFKELAIIVKFGQREKELLKQIPISKVALIPKEVFGGKEMINFCKRGVSLEYGPDKTGNNAPRAIRHVKAILRSLGMYGAKSTITRKKELYEVKGSYSVSKNFIPNSKLKNFKKIKPGEFIGKIKNKKIFSEKTFIPLFLGKGRYKKTLALISEKKIINL